ncbi:MAG: hypothetical protein E7343_04050 [Clostridiales bacterium]|nr:hypothetical protein [Clostridiales bacterium]
MTNNSKQRKKQLLALFLSAMMTTSFTVALASCTEDETTDSTEEEETLDTSAEKDSARLTNGSFEYFDDNDGKKLIITSPGSWSRSNAAGGSTSKAASGIVNTATSAWKNLTTASGETYDSVDTAKANWDKLTAFDKLHFYEEQEDEDELDFYENYNIDVDDVPTCENPRTHYYDATDATTEEKANVLMIHNDYNVSGKYGTAQRFTSSTTITVQSGTYAELSVWVKTSDLKFGSKEQDVIADRGAYIDITQTVGSTTLDKLQVKNINTELQNPNGDNNGWVQYTFYLQGCSYATSTFKVELGLGQAKVSSNTWEYVSGYAFFDDVECKIYASDSDTKGWDNVTSAVDVSNQFDMLTDADKKIVKADLNDATAFSMDMDKTDTPFENYNVIEGTNVTTALTEEKANNGKVYVSATDVAGKQAYSGLTLKTTNDFKGVLSTNNLPDHPFVQKIADKLETPDAFNSSKMILLLSSEGAAYTANVKDLTSFTVKANEYFAMSFFIKTSDLTGHIGAGATIVEVDDLGNPVGNESALSSIDTSSNTAVDVDTDEGKQEDVYKGWQQCFFFVKNETDEDRYFEIKLTYGSTTIIGTKNSDYYGGYAAFANFETRSMSDKEYGYASDGSYAKKFVLKGATEEETDGKFFDEASQVGGNVENGIQTSNDEIVKGLASPVNYTGVYGGSGFVTDDETNINQSWYAEINGNKFAGIINKEELENWDVNEYNTAIKNAVADKLGDATQPLLIYNNQATSYGFLGKSQTIEANTYATVSVRVMVSADAQANVYLIDMDDKTHKSTLNWSSGVTYWYDDDGNICTVDPTSKDFKKTDVAFKLQSNGLYQVNTKWSGYATSGVNANDYFANLSNYEKDEVTNDLLVSKDGVSYDYNEKWQNDGNDGIAFYYKDGVYYAYSNYTTPVKNLADVTGLTPRYEAQTEKTLATKVQNTDGKWVTVTFYIHTGNVAKNYRLEVWSGTREGYANPANSFVMFDASGATTLTAETFKSLVDLSKERIDDETLGDDYNGNYVEGVYSFYDAKDFLRYDSTIDKNEVGNSYENYVSSVYEAGTAYMTYEDNVQLIKAIFVDFNLSEQTVEADVEEEDVEDEEEETTTTSETNMWLLISSIVIAVVLLLAVVSIIVRKFVEKARRKKARSTVVKSSTTRKVKAKKQNVDKK